MASTATTERPLNRIKEDLKLYGKRDAFAGTITGLMAVPLSVGICMMSEYPIQLGLMTVVFACIVGFITYLFRPGNYTGVPGIAAGLAPALALGIHTFGMENMPFLIMLTASLQAVAWRFNLQRHLLRIVPPFLVEGLLAGIGLKIALKFLPFTYETTATRHTTGTHHNFLPEFALTSENALLIGLSVASMILFVALYRRFKTSFPGMPYLVVIGLGVISTFIFAAPVVKIEAAPFSLMLPMVHLHPGSLSQQALFALKMLGFSMMLATIDIIEQVMSNQAIEKMDPLKRTCDTNNSLLAIWLANLGSSFFGGMTNLDGLAKGTTNTVAGAVTKFSNLFTAAVIGVIALNPGLLLFLPKFSLGVIMIFSGWKMIAGLSHIVKEGKYAMGLAILCGLMVYEAGIFEGLIMALAVHYTVQFIFSKLQGNNQLAIAEISIAPEITTEKQVVKV